MSRWTAPLSALADRLSLSPAARREISNLSPVPLVRRNRSIFEVSRGGGDAVAQMEAYGSDGVVHPIVSRLAESTAAQEWFLETWAPEEEDRKKIPSHAVLDLLEEPNPFQTRMQIMEQAQQHFELTGECSVVLGFLPGLKIPLDMWVLRPDRIAPVPDPYAFLKGWVYTAPGESERIPLETWELLRMVRPSPLDPYRGMGAVQALLRDLDAQRYGKEWQAAFFANSARPGGILEIDRRLGDDEFEELRDRWAQQHQGMSKAHRVAILEQAKWVESSFSLRDLQMAELDSVGRDKALVAFGMPKSMLGIVEDVNRANAEAGEYVFARWMTRPRLERWRGVFNHPRQGLLARYGEGITRTMRLNFADPVPENSEAALEELDIKSQVVVRLIGPEGNMDAARVLDMVGWPDLGYSAPPPPAPAPAQLPPGQPVDDPPEPGAEATFDAAMRWKVVGHEDGNACDPCLKQQGKLYRNRQAAYADYPGGKGYIKCVGAQYGNDCRCKVVRRRQK